MKAVIMAGGFGTRLKPITESIPKPCIPVVGVPCICRIVEQLSRLGITEFLVSVMYLPDEVRKVLSTPEFKKYKITFREETIPLGTAGSVRNCLPTTDEDFIVISGDCVFDFDLSEAIRFHHTHAGSLTIVSTRTDDPLEYGVMISDDSGRISRFLEKPDWSNAFSDDVNTGIYICSPSFLEWIPDGVSDFSRDVFPEMLLKNAPIYRYSADGYWCDVGTISSYLDCTRHLLAQGKNEFHSVPVGDSRIEAPCVIGKNTRVQDCRIGPFTVIGEDCNLQGARLEGCVVGNRVTAEPGVTARNCIICDDTVLRSNCRLGDECVIGNGCDIGRKTTISACAKIYPENRIPEQSFVAGNVHHKLRNLFPENGRMLFPFGMDFGGSDFYEIGRILADVFGGDVLIGRAEQGDASASMTLCGGILARGKNVFDVGVCDLPQFRFTVRNYAFSCGVYLRRNYSNLELRFYNENGMQISSGMARKMGKKLQDDSACGEADGIYRIFRGGAKAYQTFLKSFPPPERLTVRVNPSPELASLLSGLPLTKEPTERLKVDRERIRIEKIDSGEPFDENRIRLCVLLAMGQKNNPVYLPDDFPSLAERLARENNFRVVRLTVNDPRERKLFPFTDPNVQALCILRLLSDRQCSFEEFCATLPYFSVKQREIPVSAKRAAVMRSLVLSGGQLRDGVVFSERAGTVRIVPKSTGDVFRISSEAADAETAEELCNFYTLKLKGLK